MMQRKTLTASVAVLDSAMFAFWKGGDMRCFRNLCWIFPFAILVGCRMLSCSDAEKLFIDIQNNDLGAVKQDVADGCSMNCTDNLGRTPLYLSVVYGYNEIFEWLLANGANPRKGASWKGYDTPLHVASARGNKYVVTKLLHAGVPVDIGNSMRQTPLHYAAWQEQVAVVHLLVSAGADVNARSRRSETPMIPPAAPLKDVAAYKSIIGILMKNGADVNAVDAHGYTPLKYAARYADLEAVQSLLEHGADASNNTGGNTALSFATRLGRTDIVQCLRNEETLRLDKNQTRGGVGTGK